MNKSVSIVDYRTPVGRGRRQYWRVPLFFGLLQIPWCLLAVLKISEFQSMRPVGIVKDSILDAVPLAVTLPAILLGVQGIIAGAKSRAMASVIICGIVVAVSILLVGIVAHDWYNQIYKCRHGAWGPW